MLDLPFIQDNSKALSTMIKESYSKLVSFATLVWSASHFPSLSGSRHFHSTFRTFSHRFSPPPYHLTHHHTSSCINNLRRRVLYHVQMHLSNGPIIGCLNLSQLGCSGSTYIETNSLTVCLRGYLFLVHIDFLKSTVKLDTQT